MQYEYMEIRDAIAVEQEVKVKTTSYLTLFSTRGNLKRMRIIIGTQISTGKIAVSSISHAGLGVALGFFSQWR